MTTAENGCKWTATEAREGEFDFTQCDHVLRIAKENTQVMRVHNLCWGAHNPAWVEQYANDSAQLERVLVNHVRTVAAHYSLNSTTAFCFDVVNEVISDHVNSTLKHTLWYPALPNYIDIAFRTAAKAAPEAKLFLNDYLVAKENAKSDRMYDYVSGMLQRGVPIHGVGMQMHRSALEPIALDSIKRNMARFGALGLDVHITELDAEVYTHSEFELEAQARQYAHLMQACLDTPACQSYEVWGFTDAHSWIASTRPCLYDDHYVPKPAVDALRSLLSQ